MQGKILGSFFYGYIATQIIGGYVSLRYGRKICILCGIGVLALGTLLTPLASRYDPNIVIAIRVIQGNYKMYS